MQLSGASPENIERELAKLPADDPEDVLELDAEDEGQAVCLFLALDTQWKTAGLAGVLTGLDYAAIEPTARLLGIDLKPQVLVDLRTMERETLKAQSERLAAR